MRSAFPVPSAAPEGGLNLSRSEVRLPFEFAVELDNWTISADGLFSRKGYTVSYEAGVPTNGQGTLVAFEINGNDALICGCGGRVAIVSGTPAILGAGFTSDRWSTTTQSGNLLMVNGVDYRRWDGTNFLTPALTAAGTNTYIGPFVGVVSHNEHVYFWPEDSTSFYHLEPASVQGNIYEFPMGNLGNVRGRIVEMASWTVNAMHGSNEVLVILTSKGDAVIYEGIDPTDSTDWRLMGRYKLPAPLSGGRATVKYGADLLVMTCEGVVSMTDVLRANPEEKVLGFKPETQPLEQSWAGNAIEPTTSAHLDEAGEVLLFQFTDDDGNTRQITHGLGAGAATTWSGITALDWENLGKSLYFLNNFGQVCIVEGDSDNGDPITLTHASGWISPARSQQANLKSVEYSVRCDGDFQLTAAAGSDFNENLQFPGFTRFSSPTLGSGQTSNSFRAGVGLAGSASNMQLRTVINNQGNKIQWIGSRFILKGQGKKL